MSDLFIPPEGAMQFEVTAADTQYRGETMWVIPSDAPLDDRNWVCHCDRHYEVLEETLSERFRRAFGPPPNGVCACVGRIIE